MIILCFSVWIYEEARWDTEPVRKSYIPAAHTNRTQVFALYTINTLYTLAVVWRCVVSCCSFSMNLLNACKWIMSSPSIKRIPRSLLSAFASQLSGLAHDQWKYNQYGVLGSCCTSHLWRYVYRALHQTVRFALLCTWKCCDVYLCK